MRFNKKYSFFVRRFGFFPVFNEKCGTRCGSGSARVELIQCVWRENRTIVTRNY